MSGTATTATAPPSRWAAHWCAETVRLYEEGTHRLDDGECVAQLCVQSGSDETRLLQRAWLLGGRHALRPPRLPWQAHGRGIALLVLALLLIAGGMSAVAAFGNGSQPVNIAWMWLALLGLPSATLLLWLLLLPWRRSPGIGATAWRWSWRWQGGEHARLWLRALWRMAQRSRAPLWLASTLSHVLWSALLSGALLGLLLTLSLRGYQFLWATTILPPAWFAVAVELLGWLPAQFGFDRPDAASILASGHTALADDLVRRKWSSWLLGNLVVYGLLPRLLAAGFSLWRWRCAVAALRLDLDAPYYLGLLERLQPSHARIGVVDADRTPSEALRIEPRAELVGQRNLMLGLELAPELARPPPPPGVEDLGDVDSREQRRGVLLALEQAPARRMLLLVDGRRSPDRGTLRFIAELARHGEALAVGLLGEAGERESLWRAALIERGLDPARVGRADNMQLHWLETGT